MKRLRRWLLAAAALLGVVAVTVFWLWHNPDQWVKRALKAAFRPDQVTIGDVRWTGTNTLEVTDLRIGDSATISKGSVQFDPARLRNREIDAVVISNATLRVDLQSTLTNRSGTGATTNGAVASTRPQWTVHRYDIRDSRLRLEHLGPGIPPIDVPINTTIDDKDERVTAEIRDFAIVSPYDPLARVLHFPRILFEFTWAGLEQRRLDRVTLTSPEIHVGPDLFWYADYAKNQAPPATTPAPAPTSNANPWSVGLFDVTDGRLVLAPAGQPALRLPFRYEMRQTNLVIGDFEKFNLTAALVIANLTTNYPEYQLSLEELNGRVEFALPRGSTNANNLVNTLTLTSLQWKQHRLTNLFLSVTFDERGFYTKAGGWIYGGYVTGDLTVLNTNRLDWIAGVGCATFDLAAATRSLSPGQLSARGRGAGHITARGTGKEAQNVQGEFRCLTPGTLTIHSVDTLVEKIPADWNQIKRAVVLRILDTLKNYHFTRGDVSFGWHPPLSRFDLALDGREGQRNVALKYHHAPAPDPKP